MAYTLATETAPTLIAVPGSPIEAILGTGMPLIRTAAGAPPALDTDGVPFYGAIATDYRTIPVPPAAPNAPLYLMVFDALSAPVLQSKPFVAAIEIVGFADIDFSDSMSFPNGCWIAISSTPQSYTPIASDAFALTLRTWPSGNTAVRVGSRASVDISGSTVHVEGVIAHDQPDNEATNFPVKTGSHATANARPNVGEDDMADTSSDLAGRQRVRLSGPGGDTNTTNEAQFVGGDEAHDAPDAGNPVKVGARAVASVDTGLAAVAANDRTDLIAALTGQLGVQAVGTIATGVADVGNPLKIGGKAATSVDTGLAAVANGQRQDAVLSLVGRLGVEAVGTLANDAVDAGNPLKVGGIAVADPTLGQAAAVAALDRVNQAHDVQGRVLSLVQGTQSNDAVLSLTNGPVNTGGVAQDQAPVLVSAVLDLVQQYLDRAGRAQVNQELGMAGENIALNVMRTVPAWLAVEQESADRYNTTTTAQAAAGQLVKNGAGRVIEINILNTDGIAYTVWVCNATAATAAQVVDRFTLPGVVGAEVVRDYSTMGGLYCDTGIFVVLSSTQLASITIPTPNPSGIFHIAFV